MDTVLVEKLIDSGLAKGADFVEIYEEESRGSTVSWRDQKVEAAQAGTDFGIGIRLLYGTDMKYGFSRLSDILIGRHQFQCITGSLEPCVLQRVLHSIFPTTL